MAARKILSYNMWLGSFNIQTLFYFIACLIRITKKIFKNVNKYKNQIIKKYINKKITWIAVLIWKQSELICYTDFY